MGMFSPDENGWYTQEEYRQLKVENEELKKQVQFKNQFRDYAHKYKTTLDEIEGLINKIDTSMCCAYGDYDCENCSDLKEEIVCSYKLKNLILQLIKQAKEGE